MSSVPLLGGFGGCSDDDPDERDPGTFPTTLSGDLFGDDDSTSPSTIENSRHVVTAGSTGGNTILDGFIISGGITGPTSSGAALFMVGGQATITNCLFTGNTAPERTAVLYVSSGAAIVRRCTFLDNVGVYAELSRAFNSVFDECLFLNAAGKAVALEGPARFLRCRFTGNQLGVWADVGSGSSGPEFTFCDFEDNSTAIVIRAGFRVESCLFINNIVGIFTSQGASGSVIGSRFLGNVRGLWAYEIHGSPISVVNAVFVGNEQALYIEPGIRVINCTIAANSSDGDGAGIVGPGGIIQNCIIWANRDKSGFTQSAQIFGQPAAISYTTVQGWTGEWGGLWNNGQNPTLHDPLLLNPCGRDGQCGTLDDDVRLQSASPTIDFGNNISIDPSIIVDVGGSPRFVNDPHVPDRGNGTAPIVDRGAFEFQPACEFAPFGDFNCDRRVTLVDFASWGICMLGPDYRPYGNQCGAFDSNFDLDVDLRDFADFQNSNFGP